MAADKIGLGRLADELPLTCWPLCFPNELVVAAVEETGVREQRNRALPARLMVHAVGVAGRLPGPWHRGDKPVKRLFDQTARAVGMPMTEGVFWCGRRLVTVDGLTFDLPCGKDNEAQ